MKATFVRFNDGKESVISINEEENKTFYTLGDSEKVHEGSIEQLYKPYVDFLATLEVGQEKEFNKERVIRIM